MVASQFELQAFANTERDQSATDGIGDVVYKIAETRAEREAAFRLLYESYLRAGLGGPNTHGMRVTPYHLLPTTEVFIAMRDGEVISTNTLVIDGELGLPLEAVYGNEVAARRKRGLSLGEVTCLADRRSDIRSFFPVFCQLNQLMVQCARQRGLDQLLVAVHPRHARFYVRYMCFEPIGDVTEYPSVRNHPAVALCMDFPRIDQKALEHPRRYAKFFNAQIPESQLRPHPISVRDRRYFRAKLDQPIQPPPPTVLPGGSFDTACAVH